jgi:hypothetical protein
MLGRKTYTQEELDSARKAMAEQLAAYEAIERTPPLEAFEPLFFNNLLLALDRRFVHRLRGTTGKDGTPLNEAELLVESLMNNHGILRGNNVIKYVPAESVLKLEIGDRISLSAAQFERLSKGFLAEIESKYL